ncbi:MAG TPA: DUF2238 domain-containing protein [Thermoanaerobaculia bacterium]
MRRGTILAIAAVVLVLLLGVSGLQPYDRLTWVLEVFPIVVVLPILFLTFRRFPLTTLLYALIFVHAVVLMVGGHYSYARVPLGFAIARFFGLHRNPYDKIGHFAQGFVPAIAAREVLVRGRYIRTPRMLAFVVLSIVLAISASYELFEWASAVALGQGATDFLGTQGDPWDTQSDMFFALLGGGAALIGVAGYHDRQISALQGERAGA